VGPAFCGFIVFPEGCSHGRVRVVAKIALDCHTKRALAEEAVAYASMHQASLREIPTLVGLFDDVDDDVHVLVTSDVGRSLDHPDRFDLSRNQ
jgi:hypothetical protein